MCCTKGEGDVYIEMPAEAGEMANMCGKLKYWLYGFRKAASAWEKHYSHVLEKRGFKRGSDCTVLFYHPEKTCRWLYMGMILYHVGTTRTCVGQRIL